MIMKLQHQTKWIRVLQPGFNNIGEPSDMIEAPAGFDWHKYPERMEMDGAAYRYVGAINADPHYVKEA